MSVQHCRHTKVDGAYCQAPALREREYCRFHIQTLGRRLRMARAQARREPYRLVLPILEDINAVHVARQQVIDALTSELITRKQAGLLLYALQGASADLRRTAVPHPVASDPAVDTAPCAEDYPTFEEEFDLPKGLDLSQPPEVLFPPKAAEEETRPALSAYRSSPFQQFNPEDVELEEILLTKGQEAHDKRSAELATKAWKQLDREREDIAHARHIMEAARRNGNQWTNARLKEHYQKLWAEADAREKALLEELEAQRAAARAAAAARKSPAGTTDDGHAGAESEKTGS